MTASIQINLPQVFVPELLKQAGVSKWFWKVLIKIVISKKGLLGNLYTGFDSRKQPWSSLQMRWSDEQQKRKKKKPQRNKKKKEKKYNLENITLKSELTKKKLQGLHNII